MEIHRGRLIDHLQLVVADLEASKKFYRAVFEVLGIPLGADEDDHFWYDELWVSTAQSDSAQGELTGRIHLAFRAADRDTVERFYTAGLAAGGRDHGPPGPRKYHPDYYSAFVLDPDGNNIEAVHHGEPKSISAPSVVIDL